MITRRLLSVSQRLRSSTGPVTGLPQTVVKYPEQGLQANSHPTQASLASPWRARTWAPSPTTNRQSKNEAPSERGGGRVPHCPGQIARAIPKTPHRAGPNRPGNTLTSAENTEETRRAPCATGTHYTDTHRHTHTHTHAQHTSPRAGPRGILGQ